MLIKPFRGALHTPGCYQHQSCPFGRKSDAWILPRFSTFPPQNQRPQFQWDQAVKGEPGQPVQILLSVINNWKEGSRLTGPLVFIQRTNAKSSSQAQEKQKPNQNHWTRCISCLRSRAAIAACHKSSCFPTPVSCFLLLSSQDIPTH